MNLDIVHKKIHLTLPSTTLQSLIESSYELWLDDFDLLVFWCPFTMIDGSMKRNYMFGSEPQSSLDIEKRRRG